MRNVTTLTLAAALAAFIAGPARAEAETDAAAMIDANVAYNLAQPPGILIAQGDDGSSGEDETFVFGANESQDKVVPSVEMIHFQDTTGKASRDIKRIIGWTLITTGGLSAVWAAFFHYDTHYPDDVFTGADKYELIGGVPLIHEKEAYWPSVVAGTALAGGGLWLMNHK